jgi:hypothetical protein
MHFSLATLIIVVPLLASATPLAQSPRVTIPISKRTNLRRQDGSVDISALTGSVSASIAYVISFLDQLIYELTFYIVRSFVVLIRTNRTLGNATHPNLTTTSAPLVKTLLPMLKNSFGMVRILKALK